MTETETTETKRFLIVDDDAGFTQVLARALCRMAYQVETAHCHAEALRKAREFEPDRLSLDLKMAEESGLHLLPSLLQMLPQLRVVVLTGYSSVATAVQAMKLGACNYLCKPVTVDELLAAFDEQPSSGVPIAENPVSVNRLEWEHIQKVLAEQGGNISATSRVLGMHRRTLQRKLQKRPVRE